MNQDRPNLGELRRNIEEQHRVRIDPELFEKIAADYEGEDTYFSDIDERLEELIRHSRMIEHLDKRPASANAKKRNPLSDDSPFRRQLRERRIELVLFVLEQHVTVEEVRRQQLRGRQRGRRYDWKKLCEEWNESHPRDRFPSPTRMRIRYFQITKEPEFQRQCILEIRRRFETRFRSVSESHVTESGDSPESMEHVVAPFVPIRQSDLLSTVAQRVEQVITEANTPHAKVLLARQMMDLLFPHQRQQACRRLPWKMLDEHELGEYRRSLDEHLRAFLPRLLTDVELAKFTTKWGESPYQSLSESQLELMWTELQPLLEPIRKRARDIQDHTLHRVILSSLPDGERDRFVRRWGERPFASLRQREFDEMQDELMELLGLSYYYSCATDRQDENL